MRGAVSAYLLLFCSVQCPPCAASELHTAVRAGDVGKTKALLLSGLSASERDGLGGTALHDASWSGHVPLINLLIENGAGVDVAHTETGSTPLHYAAITNHPEAATVLLHHGAKVGARSRTGATALHLAANRGYSAVVELLLASGAEVDAVDAPGNTPLLEAAWKGHSGVATLLLAKGANANAVNPVSGVTPLHEATSKGHADLVALLLTHGADTAAKDKNGNTALDTALQFHQVEVLAVFLDRGVKGSAETAAKELKAAVLRGDSRTALLLLDRGLDANTGFLLHDAALKGHADIARLLLEHGAKVGAVNANGSTALHDAALAGQAAVVDVLIANGASVDARETDSGATPLHHAASWGRLEAVKALLAKGADARITNKAGVSPAAAASANGYTETAAYLREKASAPAH
jgi:ankyrin repeat protein